MAYIHIKFILLSLFILTSQTIQDVYGQCATPPINQAVYEGFQNTILMCNRNTAVSYSIKPASDQLSTYTITYYNDVVNPSYTSLYGVNQTGLIIKTAQGTATIPPMSTAGLYIININNATRTGAKLIVIRAPPTCNCTAINSTKLNISCSLVYAEDNYQFINARMNWTSNGNFTKTETPNTVKISTTGYYTSTSFITIDASDTSTYTCNVTFAKPAAQFPYLAMNAPAFNATCNITACPFTTTILPTTKTTTTQQPTTIPPTTSPTTTTTAPATTTTNQRQPSSECVSDLKNRAVYEGQPNTIMNLYFNPQNVSWKVKSTSDELSTYTIINYGDSRDPTLTGLYDVNQTGLVIKDATTNGNPISTAGLYYAQCTNNPNRIGAKLVVVRSGPECSCVSISTAYSNVTCSIIFADSTFDPIHAIVTWKVNGAYLATYTLERTRIDPYVFLSQSTITTGTASPDEYECELSFSAPNVHQFPFVVANAPEFNESCSTSACPVPTASQTAAPVTDSPSATTTTTHASTPSSTTTTSSLASSSQPGITASSTQISTVASPQCVSSVKNIAVREGQQNTIMNLYINPQNVSWKVVPTSDELDTLTIIDYGGNNYYPTLYDVNQTGIIIKEARTNGNPISTAGLYIGQCVNNPNKTGAKFLVVQSGPRCFCTPVDYESNVSCNVTYADSSIQPIYAIVTWKLNGVFLSSFTLPRTRIAGNVFYSQSTITNNGGNSGYYICELTFASPTDIQLAYIARNAPDYNDSCSIPGCQITTTSTQTTTTRTATTSTRPPTTTTQLPTTTDCDCPQATPCPSQEQSCTEVSECRSGGTNSTDVYDECVVKAELYARCDNCCPENLVCGVVVTLRNDSRWLIHDPLCNDNKCEMVVFDASCMSTDWKLLTERKVAISGVGDYVQAGNSVEIGLNVTDCSESCRRMMTLP